MRRDWTMDELNRMAGAYFDRLHAIDISPPFANQGSDRQHLHRQAARALLAELEAIELERIDAHRSASRRSVRLERAS